MYNFQIQTISLSASDMFNCHNIQTVNLAHNSLSERYRWLQDGMQAHMEILISQESLQNWGYIADQHQTQNWYIILGETQQDDITSGLSP